MMACLPQQQQPTAWHSFAQNNPFRCRLEGWLVLLIFVRNPLCVVKVKLGGVSRQVHETPDPVWEERGREDWKENGVSYMLTRMNLTWNNVVVEREVDEVRRGR
jgi:hypothetical protein